MVREFKPLTIEWDGITIIVFSYHVGQNRMKSLLNHNVVIVIRFKWSI